MTGERVLIVREGMPANAEETNLGALGLRERQDLQQWILKDPSLLEDGLLIITEEYDQWSAPAGTPVRDRLDLLALDEGGRLVVIELKRAKASTEAHLQAINYAAMVSRVTEDDLARMYARFLSRRGESVSGEDALQRLEQHCDGELDPLLLKQPRIMLVAGAFPTQVTAAAVWLNDMGVDLKLVQFRVWRAEQPAPDQPASAVLTLSTLYPVPGLEDFTIRPARAEKAEAAHRASQRSMGPRAVHKIIDNGLIPVDTPLTFRPYGGNGLVPEGALKAWLDEDPKRGRAVWVEDRNEPLKWEFEPGQYSPTSLAKEIFERVSGVRPGNLNGPRFWIDEEGRDLVEIAGSQADGG
ncbi:endonuclease NucS domain-containing protein [Streptomyces sp. NPDC089919]|uniref:endonuclease NucS domain-containing protein n=1 Tax=Streptomyces sp. NPDC089919 TaxID=3155188 RepID=UPI003447A23A